MTSLCNARTLFFKESASGLKTTTRDISSNDMVILNTIFQKSLVFNRTLRNRNRSRVSLRAINLKDKQTRASSEQVFFEARWGWSRGRGWDWGWGCNFSFPSMRLSIGNSFTKSAFVGIIVSLFFNIQMPWRDVASVYSLTYFVAQYLQNN